MFVCMTTAKSAKSAKNVKDYTKIVRKIVIDAGGEYELSARLRIHQPAIRAWYHAGSIPEKYWLVVAKLAKVSLMDLWESLGSPTCRHKHGGRTK